MVTYGRFLLYPGEMLRIDAQRSLEVICEAGSLWVTGSGLGENRAVDHNLHAGEASSVLSGRILVEGDGIFRLSPEGSCGLRSTGKKRQILHPFPPRGAMDGLALLPSPILNGEKHV
jgi:hypothetical protein